METPHPTPTALATSNSRAHNPWLREYQYAVPSILSRMATPEPLTDDSRPNPALEVAVMVVLSLFFATVLAVGIHLLALQLAA